MTKFSGLWPQISTDCNQMRTWPFFHKIHHHTKHLVRQLCGELRSGNHQFMTNLVDFDFEYGLIANNISIRYNISQNINYIHQLREECWSGNHPFMTNLVDCDLKYGRTAIKWELDVYFNKVQYITKYCLDLSIMWRDMIWKPSIYDKFSGLWPEIWADCSQIQTWYVC